MNMFVKTYRASRALGALAQDAYRYAVNTQAQNVALTLLDLDHLPEQLKRSESGSAVFVEIAGQPVYHVSIRPDDDPITGDDYETEWLRSDPDHGEEGWGRTGRREGTFTLNRGRDGWSRVTLAKDLRLDVLIAYNRRTMSRQVAFERACEVQDQVKASIEAQLAGDVGYYGYVISRVEAVHHDEVSVVELDSCWGFDDLDCMVDSNIVPALLSLLKEPKA